MMELSSNRKTALALVLAILATQMLLNGRIQAIWAALWSPALGLGTEALMGSQAGQGLPSGIAHIFGGSGDTAPVNSTPTIGTQVVNGGGGTSSGNGGGVQAL